MTKQKLIVKQKYLAGKMIDGAKALYDLFEWLRNNREPLTNQIVHDISSNYELTQNQIEYFFDTAERAKRAQGAIRYLENRFGVDENLNFQDSEGLHRLLFKGLYCPKKIQAKSYNIGIGFIRNKWGYKDCLGKAGIGFLYDQLGTPLNQTIERLENGKLTNVADLCFTLPTKEYFKKFIENQKSKLGKRERILFDIFGHLVDQKAEKLYKITQEHELRHVIDGFLPKGKGYCETQADLYSDSSFHGLNRDLSKTNKILEENINRLAKALKEPRLEGLKTLIERTQERYNETLKRKKNFNESVEILKNLVKKIPKQDYKMLSYLFSTLPWVCSNNSLSHLKALNVYYDKEIKCKQ